MLDDSQIAALNSVYADVVERIGSSCNDRWFPTGLLPDAELRSHVSERCKAIVGDSLTSYFAEGSIEITRIDLSVKPASPNSALGPHQDYSVVDERVHRSFYLWIPLVDVDEHNGAMHVVPASHLVGAQVRSRYVPADLGPLSEVVIEQAVPLPMAAGQLLLTDAGLIHHTPPNCSHSTRVAVHGIIRPVMAPLIFYFADEQTPSGQVEGYEMTIEQYLEATQHGRPSRAPDLLQPVAPHQLTAQMIEDLCTNYRDN